MEEWKDIKGYEGKYQVSNQGNVRSLNFNNTGRPGDLKIKVNKYGFAEVKLSKYNKTKDCMVARLVAEAFIPNPSNKPQVMHISKDGLDNRADNLKWAYNSEVKFNMYKKGSRKIGVPSGNKISYKGKRYKNYTELGKDYGLSQHQLFHRLSKGWSLEEALEIPMNKMGGGRPLFYDYYGKAMTLEQISKITGIDKRTIQKRICNGWDIYSAAEIPKRKEANKKCQ
jgi:hypothetical protein